MRRIQLFNPSPSHKQSFALKPPNLLYQKEQEENSEHFIDQEESSQPKSPFTYLFNSHQGLFNNQKARSPQEIQLIAKLVASNSIFSQLNIKMQKEMLKQICNNIILLWSQAPHIVQIKENEIYLILQGKTFQYIQNTSESLKSKIDQNNDYIMMRKLTSNQYFFVGGSSTNSLVPFSKYKNQNHNKKYQLMVDEKTLMGKISDQMLSKHFQNKIVDYFKRTMAFFRKIQSFNKLPPMLFLQLSRFVKIVRFQAKQKPIQKGQKSKEVFFIKQGQVQVKLYTKHQQIQRTGSQAYLVSTISKTPKDIKIETLFEYDIFGMDNIHRQDKNGNYEVECMTDCTFYTIDKRLMAIVISTNQKELNLQQSKVVSPVNINEQISGQNYKSKERQTLTRNAERIKTAEKRIRDVKLKSYLNNKVKNFNPVIPENDRIPPQTERIQRRSKLIRTSDSGFRASNSMSLLRNKSNLLLRSTYTSRQIQSSMGETVKSNMFKSSLFNTFHQKQRVSHLIMPINQHETQKQFTLQSNSTFKQFQRLNNESKTFLINKRNIAPSNYSSNNFFSHKEYSPRNNKNVLTSRDKQKSHGKLQSDLIKTYIDKKLRNQIAVKAEIVLTKKLEQKKGSIKQIKKFFSVSQKKELVQTIAKEMDDELLNRLTRLNQCPLLMKIQSQRKRHQASSKSKGKSVVPKSPSKNDPVQNNPLIFIQSENTKTNEQGSIAQKQRNQQ